ncbi:MAG: response regulator, partial [Bacillota bacterium]
MDDNEGNLGVVTSLLARTLLQIDTALSGRQCLELAGQNHYHVILLDYMMPQMDGIRTLQRLRQMDCHIPVIALTADVTAGTRQKLLNAGFAEYLSKPVSWTGLEQTLLSYLPAPLVTRTTVSAGNACPDAALKIRRQLKQYDISLETGLQFLSQSLSQYKTIVGIFLTHTRQTADLLTQLAARHDLAALAHSAHSLKTL